MADSSSFPQGTSAFTTDLGYRPSFVPAGNAFPDYSGIMPGTSSVPAKQGFDWGAAGAATQDLLGGVGNAIRAVRGEPPVMAGSRLQEYLQGKEQDSFLRQLLASLSDRDRSKDTTKDLAKDFLLNLGSSNPFGVG